MSHIEAGRQAPTEGFTRQAEAVLQTGGVLSELWDEIAGKRLGLDGPKTAPVDRDLRTAEFVAWLAEHGAGTFTDVYQAVCARVERLDGEPAAARYAREHARHQVTREHLARVIAHYYQTAPGRMADGNLYQATLGDTGTPVLLTVATRSPWLGHGIELGTAHEEARFVPPEPSSALRLNDAGQRAAVARLASAEATETVLVNNPLYRLLDVDLGSGRLATTVTSTDFAAYALTADLLESELVDALTSLPAGTDAEKVAPASLPLRDSYLPAGGSPFDFQARHCVGGPVALLAIAREPDHSRSRDYVLLVQERSSAVLNVTGKLAVIPKAFHQPTGETADEARLSVTLFRELEEELLGREDLEMLSESAQRRADPLHAVHRSPALTWLLDRRTTGGFRAECTGFGVNLVTGNYEFPCLLVIEDWKWWETYGHLVEANWETRRIRRYSSRDTAGLLALALDPRWSNEGLFSFLQGLRRLSETDTTGRVVAPPITLEMQ